MEVLILEPQDPGVININDCGEHLEYVVYNLEEGEITNSILYSTRVDDEIRWINPWANMTVSRDAGKPAKNMTTVLLRKNKKFANIEAFENSAQQLKRVLQLMS